MPKFIKRKSVASAVTSSVWSRKTRRLFHSLNEIPWLSLTAVGTLFGVTILFWYFSSLAFFPSDFSVLIGLGVGATASASGVLCALIIGLFGPAFAYHQHLSESDESKSKTKRRFTEWEIVGLQFGGVGATFFVIAYPEFRDCGTWLSFHSMLSVVGLLVWVITLTIILRTKASPTPFWRTISTALGIAVGGMAIFLVVVPLMSAFKSEYLSAGLTLLTLWALVIFANAFVATRLRPLQTFIVGGFIVVFFFILLPLSMSQMNLFPQMTANFLGIREEAPVDLLVPAKTCQLISAAVPDDMTSYDLKCGSGDWGKVKAQILSKAGDPWLIELTSVKKEDPVATTKLRVTIPRADVQIVRRVEDELPFFGKHRTCEVSKN